ncbi:hypothetical protein ILUMI_15398, partial [Ignelater luminosus]
NEMNNDIALLKVSSVLNFTHAVKPLKLPSVDQKFEEGWISGWGIYMKPSLLSVTLQCEKMQIINNT